MTEQAGLVHWWCFGTRSYFAIDKNSKKHCSFGLMFHSQMISISTSLPIVNVQWYWHMTYHEWINLHSGLTFIATVHSTVRYNSQHVSQGARSSFGKCSCGDSRKVLLSGNTLTANQSGNQELLFGFKMKDFRQLKWDK